MSPQELSISDYTYSLPAERIATRPLPRRDGAKLLLHIAGAQLDRNFWDLPRLLPPETLLVLNDTRVVNARVVLHRESGARIEVLCLEPA
ncbi:MAG: S-adenosylmethionine:tRNA ribosyltransferase-isomerase, partial [Flavobacteriales bacterium]|nr:S-adenosylmethionine:tRNA ribosyltransferase-isomerase [Flavobacteriales bacterium]